MKRIITGRIAFGFFGAATLLGTGACTDDHFDIKPSAETAGKTIWQNIEGDNELSEFADVLRQIKVLRNEKDNNATITFAQMLNQSQTYTVFAPTNEGFDPQSYLDEIEAIKLLRAGDESGTQNAANVAEANKREYALGNRFAKNHIARFSYEANSDEHEVRLLNGKLATYNPAQGIFNGVKLVAGKADVPSSNGTMHIIEGASTYLDNVFDYLEVADHNLTKVYNILSDPAIDKEEFSPELSTPGAMNESGDMVYVDSVFINTNSILDISGAQLKDEDSLYIALLPADNAWDDAFAKVKKLYNYGKTYNYQYNRNPTNFDKPFMSSLTEEELRPDSLSEANTQSILISSAYFTPSDFTGEGLAISRRDSAGIINYITNADSLVSTNGTIYYNPNGKDSEGNPYNPNATTTLNPMFNGQKPVKVSNGYIYALDNYAVDPAYSIQSKLSYSLIFNNSVGNTLNAAPSEGVVYTLQEGVNWNKGSLTLPAETEEGLPGEPKEVEGYVSMDSYHYFRCAGATSEMKIQIPLRFVYSGKYRVKAEILPNRINTDKRWTNTVTMTDENGDTYDETVEVADQEIYYTAYLRDDNGDEVKGAVGGAGKIAVNPDKVEIVTLFDCVEFEKCYTGLPSGKNETFPILQLSMPRYGIVNGIREDWRPEAKTREYGISISRIILEPIRDAETNE